MTRLPFSGPVLPFALGVLAAFAMCTTVSAEAPHGGVRSNHPAQTLRADGYSVLLNASGLGPFRGSHGGINMAIGLDFDNPSHEEGLSLFLAHGTKLGIGFGGAVEVMRGGRDAVEGTLAIGAGRGPVSFGYAHHFHSSNIDAGATGISSGELSFTLRPARWIGLSGTVRNLGAPARGDSVVRRRYSWGLGLRSPLSQIEAEFMLSHLEGGTAVAPLWTHGVLAWRHPAGFRIFAGARSAVGGGLTARFSVDAGIEISAGNAVASASYGNHVSRSGRESGFTASLEILTPANPQSGTMRDTLLKIDLSGDVRDAPQNRLLGVDTPSFLDLLHDIHQVATTDEMGGVYVVLSGLRAGPAQLWELRQALDAVRDAGKLVVCYLNRATVRDLYIADAADWVAVPPTFYALETGIGITRTYLGDLLHDLSIEAQFVKIGDYKTSPEQYTNSAASPEADEQTLAYMNTFWEELVSGFGRNRPIGPLASEETLLDAPLTAEALQSSGFVDFIGYEDELSDTLEDHFGRRLGVSSRVGGNHRDLSWGNEPTIAVLHVNGSIVIGTNGRNLLSRTAMTGSRSIESAVDSILADSSVRGVIVRVDSPGGSAIGSDEMHRALSRLAEGKPTVVSMGDAAASGGYYVAAIDAPVLAAPTTMTGSIGIYAGTFGLDAMLAAVGVNRDRVAIGGPDDLYTGVNWSERDREAVQAAIEASYALFLQRVGDARGMSTEDVDALAQGRIWSGSAAVENGLVDEIGGFIDAWARLTDDLPERIQRRLRIRHYPRSGALSIPNMVLARAVARIEEESGALHVAERVLDAVGMQPWAESVGTLLSAAPGTPMAHVDVIFDGL